MNSKITKLSPVDGAILYELQMASESNIDEACSKARMALPRWRAVPISKRIDILKRFSYIVQQDKDTIVDTIRSEIGKPHPEAETEVIETADIIDFYTSQVYDEFSEWAEIEIDSSAWTQKAAYKRYSPVGVYAVIKPWNYPFELPIWSIVPILIAGNTVVLKPSELSTQTGLLLTELLYRAGIPDDVLVAIVGDGTVGRYLVDNGSIDGVSFTGSSSVGKGIYLSNQSRVKRLSLEMGGSDFGIVLDDANIELAAQGLTWGSFSNAGQVCTATERILVHDSIYEEFKDRFVEETRKLRVGIDIGPIITHTKLQEVLNTISESKTNGCKVLAGGDIVENSNGNYLIPTIIECNNDEHSSKIEELFSPVVYLSAFSCSDDLIAAVNSSPYGLGCSIWTDNIGGHRDIVQRIDCGMVWINEVNLPLPQVPWLGMKESSVGFALSKDAVYDAANCRVMHIDSGKSRREWWYPY